MTLIHDLHLRKQSAELLASRLQEKHFILHPGSNNTFYRKKAIFAIFHLK